MSPDEISVALRAGRLVELCSPPREAPDAARIAGGGQLQRCDLAGMTSDQITAALKAGRLTDLGVAAG